MEKLTKYILRKFRFLSDGLSMELATEFKQVLAIDVLQQRNTHSSENRLSKILVELEDGTTTNWIIVEQAWGAGDDADDYLYLFESNQLSIAQKYYKEFNE